MESDTTQTACALEPGEWVATAGGRVIAHGFDFHQVAEDACCQADDIVFEQAPSQPPDLRPVANPTLVVQAFPTGPRARRGADAMPRRATPPLPLLH